MEILHLVNWCMKITMPRLWFSRKSNLSNKVHNNSRLNILKPNLEWLGWYSFANTSHPISIRGPSNASKMDEKWKGEAWNLKQFKNPTKTSLPHRWIWQQVNPVCAVWTRQMYLSALFHGCVLGLPFFLFRTWVEKH